VISDVTKYNALISQQTLNQALVSEASNLYTSCHADHLVQKKAIDRSRTLIETHTTQITFGIHDSVYLEIARVCQELPLVLAE
jgi:hypothetical protein